MATPSGTDPNDFGQHPITNLVLFTSPQPTNPVEGQIYRASADGLIRQYIGGSWQPLGQTSVPSPSGRTYAGMIVEFAGTVAPPDTIFPQGQSLLRSDYPDLFARIGTTWGAADSTHFNVPDRRGLVSIGAGTSPYSGVGPTAHTLAQVIGEEKHTLNTNEIPGHTHGGGTYGAGNHQHTYNYGNADGGNGNVVRAAGNVVAYNVPGGVNNPTGDHTHSIATDGGNVGGGSHNNMQPSVVMNYLMYTRDSFVPSGAFAAYKNGGTQSGVTAQVLATIDTARLISAPNDFSLSLSVITINVSGYYTVHIEMNVPGSVVAATRTMRLEQFTNEAIGSGTALLVVESLANSSTNGLAARDTDDFYFNAGDKVRATVAASTSTAFGANSISLKKFA